MSDSNAMVPLPAPAAEPEGWQTTPHPEEMKAGFQLRWGDRMDLRGQARLTPAGLVTAGLAVSAVLLGIGFVLRSARGRARP